MSLFKGHTTVTRADKISSFSVTTAEYGAFVPEILGTTRVSGNVIYYDDFTAHEHRETQTTGKGGKSKSVSISYTYTVATIIGLCEGPISGIGKVWIDKDVYNYPDDAIQLTCYKGTQDQEPWAYVTGAHPEKALAYPGLAYMAGVIDLGDSGTMINYNFEVKGLLLDTGDGIDVNPADYIRRVMDRVGLSDIEIDGLDNYRDYCREADMLISTPDDADVQSARETINAIADITNAYVFWSDDRFKIVPKSDRSVGGWAPDKTIQYDLTADHFLPQSGGALVTYKRKDPSEIYNMVPVEYINRDNAYETETVAYKDADDIAAHGLRKASTKDAHYLYTKTRALKLAEELWRGYYYGRNQYTFKLDWRFCRLEPGDLVRLTDTASGINGQVAMISSVTEDSTGILTFTAVSRPDGEYSTPVYDVDEVSRPYVNYNTPAPDVAKPVILQPPADLTTSGLELWVGVHGSADNWGGCNVWVSDDGNTYKQVGQITNSARIGKLINNMTADADSCVVSCSGSLNSGTAQDADRGNTLCWIDGECLSYETATLLDSGNYQLGGLVRGQYTTTAGSHSAGVDFARLDETLLKYPLSTEDIGKKIWIKFASYNIFGYGQQDLADVDPYQYTITSYYIPPVTSLTAYNRYREMADGVSRYDIVVGWIKPDMDSYLEGQVWYKTNNGQSLLLTPQEGVASDEIGYTGGWTFGGSGTDQVVIPQAVVGDTYRIAVTTKDKWGQVTSPDLAPTIDILVALKTTTPNTPDGLSISFEDQATASWSEVTNADIALYELRDDVNPGAETVGLLARTTGLTAVLPITERSGTIYLYAKSAIGKYSTPAILTYNKPVPETPAVPTVTAKLGGLSIVAGSIPSGCIGMIAYINDKAVKTINNTLTYTCDAGIYDACVSYYDLFGEGAKSPVSRVTVKATVDSDLLEDEAVTMAKIDQAVQQGIDAGIDAHESVVQIVSALNGEDGAPQYTAIVQLNDAIALRVKSDEVITQINLSKEGVQINGKLIHITGDTIIDGNVITSEMIQASAITADKLSVDSLSAITGTIGTLRTATSGARTEIKDNLIEVYDANNNLRVRMGVWSD
nr:MAG TPA: tail protein [Bacteriophage sp.]